MTGTTQNNVLGAGDKISFRFQTVLHEDEFSWLSPRLVRYGDTITLTQKLIDFWDYPEKESWLSKVDLPDASGHIKIFSGEWPTDEPRSPAGSVERDREHYQAFDVASAETDPEVRKRMMWDVRQKFGSLPSTQHETNHFGGFKPGGGN